MTTHVMTHDRPSGRHASAAVAAGNGMAGGLPTGANDIVDARVLSRCVERLQVKYGTEVEADVIRRTVQRTYRELESSARLRTFLPITAAHLAENRLRELARQARTGRAGEDSPRPGAREAGTVTLTEPGERAAA